MSKPPRTEEEIIQAVSRAIGCTMSIPNHYQWAMLVLKAVRGEWEPPRPTNPQREGDLPLPKKGACGDG